MIPESKSPGDPPAAWHGRRGELLVVIQFALFFAFVLAPPWSPWAEAGLPEWTHALRLSVLWVLGLAALALAGFGAMQIRGYLTPLPYPVAHSQLVTGGVYGLVRHPLYSSQLIAALGWTCYTLSLGHLAILALGFLFFDYKAGKEERWLTERHPEYANYARRVRKLVPWIY
jgi:protein-S-isoprenylcysteine O-methyltransferase Ste14